MLVTNATWPPRDRLPLIRVLEALRGRGYYAVHRYAKGWKREHPAITALAFVPVVFAPR